MWRKGSGAEEASRTGVRCEVCAWGKFNELALILTMKGGASMRFKGYDSSLTSLRLMVTIYKAFVQSVLGRASERTMLVSRKKKLKPMKWVSSSLKALFFGAQQPLKTPIILYLPIITSNVSAETGPRVKKVPLTTA